MRIEVTLGQNCTSLASTWWLRFNVCHFIILWWVSSHIEFLILRYLGNIISLIISSIMNLLGIWFVSIMSAYQMQIFVKNTFLSLMRMATNRHFVANMLKHISKIISISSYNTIISRLVPTRHVCHILAFIPVVLQIWILCFLQLN